MKKYKLILEKQDLDIIGKLMDAGVKATGLTMVKPAAYILSKLETAEEVNEEEKEKDNGSEEING